MIKRNALLAVLVPLSLVACDGLGTEPAPATPVDLVAESGPVQEGTILTLGLPEDVVAEGHAFTEAAYPGTIAETSVTFGRIDEVTLGTVVPAVGTDNAAITVDLGDRYVGHAMVTIETGAAIADPDGLIEAEVANLRSFAATSEPPPGFSVEEWAAFQVRVDSVATAAESAFAGLGPAERLAAARLMRSVAEGDDPFGGNQSLSALPSREDVCTAALTRSVGQINRFFLGIGLMVAGATMTGSGIGAVLGVVVGTVGALTAFNEAAPVFGTVAQMFGQCGTRQEITYDTEPFSLQRLAWGETGPRFVESPGELRLRVGEEQPIYVMERVRPVDGSDAGDPKYAWIAARLDELHAYVEELPALVRAVLPPIPGRLTGSEPRPLSTSALEPVQVRVETISSPGIEITARASGEALLLTATGVDLPEETAVSFELVTTTEPIVRTPVQAVVVAPQDSTRIYELAAIGMWTVSLTDGTGEPRSWELFDTDAGDGWKTAKYYTEPVFNGLYDYCPNGPPVVDGRCAYSSSWRISRSQERYYLEDSGFWHPAFGGEERDPLTMPITGFTTYSNYSEGTPSRRFARN